MGGQYPIGIDEFLLVLLFFFHDQGWTLEVIERIMKNFRRTSGLFNNSSYRKLFALILLALSCLGTKGVKNGKFRCLCN
nr:YWFCY domain-containing protein [Chryseobacterium arachidis]